MDRAAEPELNEAVTDPAYGAKLERIYRLRLTAFDRNCPQHVTPRFSEHAIAVLIQPLYARLEQLEAEKRELRAGRTPVAQTSSRIP